MIFNSVLDTIGNTPLVRLFNIEKKYNLKGELYAKVEFYSPGLSKKDRIAKYIIEKAIKDGSLKDGQTVIALFDGDDAGVKSMNQVIPCTLGGKSKWDINNFGKARKNHHTWFSFYPPYVRRKNIKNFNVEDYFTCQLFRKYIFSFTSLDTIISKDNIKHRLDDDCKKGNINEKYYEKFSTLFDHIIEIKEAEKQGKAVL